MLRDLPPVPPEQLYPRRLAYRALSLALDALGMAGIALKLSPDDPTQALPGNQAGEVVIFEDFAEGRGSVIATVLLEGTRGRVTVERLSRLVRRSHLRDFRPEEVGVSPRPDRPDVDVEVDLAEVIEQDGELMRTAPQRRPPPRYGPRGAPETIRAFGGTGRG